MILIEIVIAWILYQTQAPLWTYAMLIVGAVGHVIALYMHNHME